VVFDLYIYMFLHATVVRWTTKKVSPD